MSVAGFFLEKPGGHKEFYAVSFASVNLPRSPQYKKLVVFAEGRSVNPPIPLFDGPV